MVFPLQMSDLRLRGAQQSPDVQLSLAGASVKLHQCGPSGPAFPPVLVVCDAMICSFPIAAATMCHMASVA